MIHCKPDLSSRPFSLRTERIMALLPHTVFDAWTKQMDVWIATPGSVLMTPEVNTTFFFETDYKFEKQERTERQPHYGRFLRLKADRLIEVTWVSGEKGTKGVETVVTVELTPRNYGTLLRLTHAGFPDEESRNQHEKAWPIVLDQMEKKVKEYKMSN